MALTTVLLGLGSNPGEDMDVFNCMVPSRQESTLNSRRGASPLERLVEVQDRWEVPDHSQDLLPQNWGETELNHTVTCMVFKATANDKHHLALCHDEFRHLADQVELGST
ncbi:cullin-4A [Trichonephila clavipes]|nr:cullin-4A [Trichonephila clavipes]